MMSGLKPGVLASNAVNFQFPAIFSSMMGNSSEHETKSAERRQKDKIRKVIRSIFGKLSHYLLD